MKKHIASLLIFLFTLQIVTPSFAQSSQGSDLVKLNTCLDAITKSGEVFKTETNIGENFNRLSVMKGMILLFSDFGKDLVKEKDSEAMENFAGYSLVLFPFSLIYPIIKMDPYDTGRQTIVKAVRSVGVYFLVTFSLSFLTYIMNHSHKYFSKTNQNNQEVNVTTIKNAVDEHDLNAQLSSDSTSARKFLSDAVKGCEQIRSGILYYEKNPAEFQKLINQKKM